MGTWKQELVSLSDEVWQRTWRRLDGLTDEEYLWEPAAGCWTVRPGADGVWRADGSDGPVPPLTTLAWRLWHLTDLYGEDRAHQFLGVEPQGSAVGLDDPDGQPSPSATGALELLDLAHQRWDRHLAAVTDEALGESVGQIDGHDVERSRASFVLHMIDEFVHHGAEVSLLRDLWLAQRGH